jgi:hypothetical protein
MEPSKFKHTHAARMGHGGVAYIDRRGCAGLIGATRHRAARDRRGCSAGQKSAIPRTPRIKATVETPSPIFLISTAVWSVGSSTVFGNYRDHRCMCRVPVICSKPPPKTVDAQRLFEPLPRPASKRRKPEWPHCRQARGENRNGPTAGKQAAQFGKNRHAETRDPGSAKPHHIA